MVDIYTEKDRLSEARIVFLQEVRYSFRHKFCALFENQIFVIILDVIFSIFNLNPILVPFTFCGTITFQILINSHTDNFIWRKETVFNTLTQSIGINRFSEILNIGGVLCLFWGGRHTNLRSVLKVFQNFSPSRIVFCAAAMAFVYDNQIKKVWRKLFICISKAYLPCYSLINCKIDLISLVHFLVADLSHFPIIAIGVKELKIFTHRVIYKYIPIRQK